MESFFHTLNTELVHHRTYVTRDDDTVLDLNGVGRHNRWHCQAWSASCLKSL